MKIYIADDHQLIREGLKKIFKYEADLDVIGDTGNPHDVIPFIYDNNIDILILDLNFPGKSGMDILKEVKLLKPSLHVLVLSMNPEDRYATRALKAGASGYVSKDCVTEEIIKAVRKAASGGKYVSHSLAEKLAFDLDITSGKKGHELLSDREFEILRLIAQGKSQGEISEILSIHTSTVNTYRGRIIKKLGIKTNADIIYYAMQNKLIE
jgi:Response regulator containing a CheY-like receiver domain and an HTH DNA-binding domain